MQPLPGAVLDRTCCCGASKAITNANTILQASQSTTKKNQDETKHRWDWRSRYWYERCSCISSPIP